MSDVFISYSRQDAAFVRNLHDALKAAKRESWVDWEGIPPSAEWMGEIQRAIAAADTFVFVVSHHSAASTVCRAEVEFATEQGKRIVPVVCSEPEIATVPDAVARLNWIFFRPEDPFSERFATLLNALDTDLEHVRAHTRILVRARTWTDHRQDSSYLLRGSDLETAERWLEASREKLPPVTPLQSRYLAESRRTQAQRQRRLLAGVAVALALSIALGVLAYLQRNAAIAARDEAESQRRLAVARALASESELAVGDTGDRLELATLLAVESLQAAATNEGKAAFQRRMALLPRAPTLESELLGDTSAGAFSDDLTTWAAGTKDGEVIVGRVADGAVLARWQAVNSPVRSLAFHPRGHLLAIGAQQAIAVWEVNGKSRLVELGDHGTRLDTLGWVDDVVFSHDGRRLYAAGEGYGVEVVSTQTWQREAPLLFESSRVFSLALHPRQDTLAVGGFGWAAADTATGKLQIIPDQRREEIRAMRFSRGGQQLAIADLAVRVWDVALSDEGTLETQPADQLIVTNDPVHDLDFDSDGPYLAVARDDMAQVLNAKTGQEVQRIPTTAPVRRATFVQDRATLLMVAERFSTHQLFDGHRRYRTDLAGDVREAYFIANGKWLVTVDSDGQLRILDPEGLDSVMTIALGKRAMTATSPDGRWLAAVGRKALLIVDTETLTPQAPPAATPDTASPGLHFDPSSRYLLALGAAQPLVFDIAQGRWITLSTDNGKTVWKSRFSEDGRWLALISRSGTELFPTNTWEAWPAIAEGELIALSPDETLACTLTEAQRGRRSSMRHVWRLPSGERIAFGRDPNGVQVAGVADLRGGDEALLQGCAEWAPLVWAAPRTGGPRQSPRWTVTTNASSVMVYPRQVPDMIAEACARVSRNLSAEEWERFLPGEPYRATCENQSQPAAVTPVPKDGRPRLP
ncbi:MAG: TIR domain-containing protein [Gammaproteobacteria bacterium]|nr:TIR domain-containing protein [Gammaproteobacteria bacterium]